MTAIFPTGKLNTTSMPDAVANQTLAANQHTQKHNDLRDEIIAVQDKLGVNNSADANSVDYKLTNASSINPGHKHSVAGLNATGTADSTTFLRGDNTWQTISTTQPDASATVKGVTRLSVAPVVATTPIAVGDNDGRVPTQSENDALQGTSGTPSNTNRYVTNDDTATSGANKVLRLNGSGQLPALDASLLTGIPTPIQRNGTLTMGSGGAQLYNTFQVTTVPTGVANGAYLYASSFASAQASGIHAFLVSNGYAYRTARTFTTPWTTNQQVGLIALGSFVYGVAFTGGAWVVNRWDAGTLANSTAMTISGGAINAAACFTDGTSLYFYTSSNTMARYTVSGTTLTFQANVTFTNVQSNMPMYSDGTTVWQTDTTANNETIYRWAIAGGSRTTVTSFTHGITSSSSTSQNEVMSGTVKIAGGTDMMVFAYSTNNQPQVQFVTRNAI